VGLTPTSAKTDNHFFSYLPHTLFHEIISLISTLLLGEAWASWLLVVEFLRSVSLS
jgi:hypothetical protein